MKRVLRLLLFLVILVGIFFSCRQYQTQILDFFDPPTARERYVRKFKNDTLRIQRWQREFQKAVNDSFTIPTPYAEGVNVTPNEFKAFTYDFSVTEGSLTKILLQPLDTSQQLFYQLVRIHTDKVVEEGIASGKPTTVQSDQPGPYKLIVQPSVETAEPFAVRFLKLPHYAFPVSGKGNAAVQSFWGASRDGGRRKHEGIDIFAKSGTPVVASVDGYVMRTGNRGLGGKQVWLKESLLGSSLYYAHLDRIAVAKGTKVRVGDTLGFVGNTGNAKHTPPHLHFGIYKRYRAVDPLPFVKTYPSPSIDTTYQFREYYRLTRTANIRKGPGTQHEKIERLSPKQPIEVIGKSNQWYRIVVSDTLRGFVHQSLIRPITEEVVAKVP